MIANIITKPREVDVRWQRMITLDLLVPGSVVLANLCEEIGCHKSQPVCSALPPLAPPSIGRPWA